MKRITARCSIGLAVILATLAACSSGCCRRKVETYSLEAPSGGWSKHLPPPADKEVSDLLDGLKPGDSISGFPVAAVGAVNTSGVIPIVFVKDGLGVTIVVSQLSEQPPPPASTRKYGVYYQVFDGLKSWDATEVTKIVNGIVERLKRTEDHVAEPKGLKPLPRPGKPA